MRCNINVYAARVKGAETERPGMTGHLVTLDLRQWGGLEEISRDLISYHSHLEGQSLLMPAESRLAQELPL